jgi:hypothetical protein
MITLLTRDPQKLLKGILRTQIRFTEAKEFLKMKRSCSTLLHVHTQKRFIRARKNLCCGAENISFGSGSTEPQIRI